jgi:hypothetical protein
MYNWGTYSTSLQIKPRWHWTCSSFCAFLNTDPVIGVNGIIDIKPIAWLQHITRVDEKYLSLCLVK